MSKSDNSNEYGSCKMSSYLTKLIRRKQILVILVILGILGSPLLVIAQSDSARLEALRTESGVDPTRVQSRISNSVLWFAQGEGKGQANLKVKLTLGVNRWSFGLTGEMVTKSPATSGSPMQTGIGDIRFSILNAVYVSGKSSVAVSGEFAVPTGKPGLGNQYFSFSPGFTYAYTVNRSLFIAAQPQYTFHLFKDPLYPKLSVLAVRIFLAKFTSSGIFLVAEPRPVFDFTAKKTDLILSPIVGKSLGAGFNIILLAEYSTNKSIRQAKGSLIQVGVNKNF